MSESNGAWKNRIVGYDNVPPDQLLVNPSNFRRHPKRQQDAMTGSLNELGWVQDIIVNRVTQHVLDGHLRVELALRNGEPTVPVKYIELDEQSEKLALAVFDPIGAMAETDSAILDALLRDVQTGESALQGLLEELAIDAGLVPPDDPNEHWQGMPSFEQEDKMGYQSIHVHFKSAEDRDAFADLVGQKLTDKTRSIWYPYIEIETYADKRYEDES